MSEKCRKRPLLMYAVASCVPMGCVATAMEFLRPTTPAGIGDTSSTYLRPGDELEASIAQIGTLVSPVEAE